MIPLLDNCDGTIMRLAMHVFDKDISFSEIDGNGFEGTLTDGWSINGNPNGGYLMAVLASAMKKKSDKTWPSIVTTTFLSRTALSRTRVNVDTISQSKSFTRLQASLVQEGNETVRAWGTFSDENVCYGDSRYEQTAPPVAPLETCIPIPNFGTYTLYGNMDVRLDPCCAGWFQGQLSDISEHKGWISFKDGRPVDTLALILMADSFPPPVLSSHGMVAWVPTVELTVNIRSLPKTPWVKACFRSRYITCGLVEEDGELWDDDGNLLAISRQIAQFRKTA